MSMNSDQGQFIIVKQFTTGKLVNLQKASDSLNLQCLYTQNLCLLASLILMLRRRRKHQELIHLFPLENNN